MALPLLTAQLLEKIDRATVIHTANVKARHRVGAVYDADSNGPDGRANGTSATQVRPGQRGFG